MQLKQIEAFLKIANNKSFSKTAKELFLTQPTVSAYITSLEEELGTQLFARTTKAVELTENGTQLYGYAKDFVELADTMQGLFRKSEGAKQKDEIAIAASSVPAQYLLPRILAVYSKQFPHTCFRVIESDSASVIEDIVNQKAAIGFVGAILKNQNCSYLPFFQDELILVAPNLPQYRALQHCPSLDWVQKEPFILRETGSGTRYEGLKFLKKNSLSIESLHIIATCSNTDTILMSVKEGMGLSVVSRLAAQQLIAQEQLLGFKLSQEGYFRNIYLVTSLIHPLDSRVHALMETAKQLYADKSNL